MTDTLRARAQWVVGAFNHDGPNWAVEAVKSLRDFDIARHGAPVHTLREYMAAVEWAAAQPAIPAADLPVGSVVANHQGAFFKTEDSADEPTPWGATHLDGRVTDVEVDEAIAARAQVLRVGTGQAD